MKVIIILENHVSFLRVYTFSNDESIYNFYYLHIYLKQRNLETDLRLLKQLSMRILCK